MAATQQLLFPDSQPLVERLGRDFFRELPERPGVYLMRDANDVVLYIGKAKNLRKRLSSYRVANPDRMPRRHLRLLRSVTRIELQECADERAALAREAELLRSVRPRFNRAGTWPGPTRFFAWRSLAPHLHLAILESPHPEWCAHGPLGWQSVVLRGVLARLIWVALNPHPGFRSLPVGWSCGWLPVETAIDCGAQVELVTGLLEKLLDGNLAAFSDWVCSQLPPAPPPFERSCIQTEFELLSQLCQRAKRPADKSYSATAR